MTPRPRRRIKTQSKPSEIEALKEEIRCKDDEIYRLHQLMFDVMPERDYVDIILEEDKPASTERIAKDYGYTNEEFHKLLSDIGVEHRIYDNQFVLTAEYIKKGYYVQIRQPIVDIDSGYGGIRNEEGWTKKGRLFLYMKLKQNNIVPKMEIPF